MLFTSSFKLLGVAAFLLPALLVGASPHSLSERQGTGEITRHLKLHGYDVLDPNQLKYFKEVTLSPITGKVDTFIVDGDWRGIPAQAKEMAYKEWVNELTSSTNILAYGQDGAESVDGTTTWYIIFEEERKDSEESDVTEKGR